MSLEQRQAVDALMRDAPLDIGGEVAEQRAIVEQMMASFGRADDVATSDTTLGGVRATLVETRAPLPIESSSTFTAARTPSDRQRAVPGLPPRSVGVRVRAPTRWSTAWRPSIRTRPRSRTASPPTAVCSTADSMPARSPSPANRRELDWWPQPSFERRPQAYPSRRAQH